MKLKEGFQSLFLNLLSFDYDVDVDIAATLIAIVMF